MRRRICWLLSLGFLLAGLASAQSAPTNPKAQAYDLRIEGQKLYEADQFAEALAKYEEAYNQAQEAVSLLGMFYCYLQLNRVDDALSALNDSMEIMRRDKAQLSANKGKLEELAGSDTRQELKPYPRSLEIFTKLDALLRSLTEPATTPVTRPGPSSQPEIPKVPTSKNLAPVFSLGAAGVGALGLVSGGAALFLRGQVSEGLAEDDSALFSEVFASKAQAAGRYATASVVLLTTAAGLGVAGFVASWKDQPEASLSVSLGGLVYCVRFASLGQISSQKN